MNRVRCFVGRRLGELWLGGCTVAALGAAVAAYVVWRWGG